MVDLGFLLISFFVFTSAMARPKTMNINMPDNKLAPGDIVCQSCVLTVLLKKDNVIQYYEGIADAGTILKATDFSPEGIRHIILQKIKSVKQVRGRADDFVLIIKPTDESSFDSFVNMMDETAINIVKHYYIGDIDKADEMLLAK